MTMVPLEPTSFKPMIRRGGGGVTKVAVGHPTTSPDMTSRRVQGDL
jgi:hypothetical protein